MDAEGFLDGSLRVAFSSTVHVCELWTFNAGKAMLFLCLCLHASHYYPLPFAVFQPVLMSTGHTPMYTSAVSTLVRAQ